MSLSKVDEANAALGMLAYNTTYLVGERRAEASYQAIRTLKEYVNKPRHVVGVSVLITDGQGNVLLGKRNKDIQGGGLYSTPGGKVDLGETLEQAVIRETQEECGIDISQYFPSNLGFKQHHRYGDHSLIFYMHVTIRDKAVRDAIHNVEPDKCDGWEWFPIGSVPEENCMTEPEEFIHALYVREVCD